MTFGLKFAFVSILFNVLSYGAYAQDRQPLFETIEQIPYGFMGEDDVREGYLYDIANLISAEAGFERFERLAPLKRIVRDLKADIIDCTILASTPLVHEIASVIEPIGVHLDVGVIARKEFKLDSYQDLYGVSIAVPRGVSFDEKFGKDEELQKITSKDYKQSVLILARGRVDAIAGGIDSILYNAVKSGFNIDQLFGKPLVFRSLEMALVCRKEIAESKMVMRLKAATKLLRERGAFKPVIKKYF